MTPSPEETAVANAFADKPCRDSFTPLTRISRLNVSCDWPEIPDTGLNRENTVQLIPPLNTTYFNVRGGGGGGCSPLRDTSNNRVVNPDIVGRPYVGDIRVNSTAIEADIVYDTYDTCGDYIETIVQETRIIADVGPCPE